MEIGRTLMHDKMQRGLGSPLLCQETALLYFKIRINYSPIMSSMDFYCRHISPGFLASAWLDQISLSIISASGIILRIIANVFRAYDRVVSKEERIIEISTACLVCCVGGEKSTFARDI